MSKSRGRGSATSMTSATRPGPTLIEIKAGSPLAQALES